MREVHRALGERNPKSTCSDHEVSLAVELVAEGMPTREVAKKFEVSQRTVRSWVAGERRSLR